MDKINRFEEFLRDRHGEEYIGTKDMMIDDFEDWLTKLDIDQWINYGEWFGNLIEKKLIEKQIEDKYKRFQMGNTLTEESTQ